MADGALRENQTRKEQIMPGKTFAETTNDVKTMLAGLKANPDVVSKRGIDADFVSKFGSVLDKINKLDNEQEALKARLKTKTAELDEQLANILAMYSEAKKVVKMSVDQTGWREYGIEDKK